MGAKKKKEGKKGDEKEVVEHKPAVLQSEREKWVILDFRLLNWKYMNFSMKFREDTHIFTVKKVLAKRHGKMEALKICLNAFAESNEITDEMLTLVQCGMRGQPINILPDNTEDVSNVPMFQIFYDFKPQEFGDPVLLYFST